MSVERKVLMEKWAPILNHEKAPSIGDSYKQEVTAVLLENTAREMKNADALLTEAAHVNGTGGFPDAGGVAKYDPVLISLVRRSMPQLMAYDICGVQPMNQPTGLIFAMRSKYSAQDGTEALFNEADTGFSGKGTQAGTSPNDANYTTGTGMTTVEGERLGQGGTGDGDWNQMAFSIEKTAVEAKTRALKAEYTLELAQDMRSLHGIDAEAELSNILATEILSEINREVIRTIYNNAKVGAQTNVDTEGTFDLNVDSSGRWSVEKFKGLMFQIEKEANLIGQQTRRGRGNFIICSADVASALSMAGVLDHTPALQANNSMTVDDTTTTYAGILNGKYKVFVDPYSANGSGDQYVVVGYKGTSAYDAGLFYCPYVPLQMVRAIDSRSFQPKIGFKTRYGMVSNPFVQLTGTGNLKSGENFYYRRFKVTGIHG